MKVCLTLILLCFLAATANVAAAETGAHIRLLPMSKQQFLRVADLHLDVLSQHDETLDVYLSNAELDQLRRDGIPLKVIQEDVVGFYQARNTSDEPMGGFRTFAGIVSFLDSISSEHPQLTSGKFSVGSSLEGRDLWVLKVSDNSDIDEDEPELLYCSLIHSREPASAAVLLNFLAYLLDNYGSDPQITELIDEREMYFFPVQNPDGYVFNETTAPSGGGMWRKNRSENGDGSIGVDLNRNFSYQWGFDNLGSSPDPSATTYRGPSPFSEPESQAFRDFVVSRNFVVIHNLHSYSNLELWPYAYDRVYSDEEGFFKSLGDSLTKYNGYNPGVGWSLYPTNGNVDDSCWGDESAKPKIISLTSEIGSAIDGFWPAPENVQNLLDQNIWPNLYLAQVAADPYIIAPPKAPTVTGPATVDSDFTVSWQHDDAENPAVSFTLFQYKGRRYYTDDAESDPGFWNSDRMNLSTLRSHSGSSSWASRDNNRAHHWLLAQDPYLVQPNDSLRFWIWYSIEEGFDYFYAQMSIDGGQTFVNLPGELTTNSDPNGLNLGNGITGNSAGWVRMAFDLSLYEGYHVYFRLAYFTDYYTYWEGVYLDDIENIERFDDISIPVSGSTDSEFQIVGAEPDDYYYRVLALDAQGQQSPLSVPSHTRVFGPLVLGDLDESGVVDISDIVFLVEWQFNQGPAPARLASADLDCSGVVDISDTVFMVEYMFNFGPAPDCPISTARR